MWFSAVRRQKLSASANRTELEEKRKQREELKSEAWDGGFPDWIEPLNDWNKSHLHWTEGVILWQQPLKAWEAQNVAKMSESDPKVFLICLKVVSRWTASGSLIVRDGKNPG